MPSECASRCPPVHRRPIAAFPHAALPQRKCGGTRQDVLVSLLSIIFGCAIMHYLSLVVWAFIVNRKYYAWEEKQRQS
eukprot:3543564-Prymnesium_polylepis.1